MFFLREIYEKRVIYTELAYLFGVILLVIGTAFMTMAFFGMWHFEGIKAGTPICAVLNRVLISAFTKIFDKIWFFEDYLKNRRVKL